MKQLILLACAVFTIFHVSAQNQPGSFFITTSAGATVQKDNYGNTSRILQINPSVNFMLNERWSLGMFLNHGRSTSENEISASPGSGYGVSRRSLEIKQRSYSVGPQVRYYQPVISRLFFFGEAQAGCKFESLNVSESYYSYYYNGDPNSPMVATGSNKAESKATSVQVNVSPGLVYFVKPRFGLELKMNVLYYNHGLRNSVLPGEDAESKSFRADFSLANSSLGASFYF